MNLYICLLEETEAEVKVEPDTEQKDKVLDLNRPVKLTSETVVVVDGKKCVLRVDPDTKHLVAYPLMETQTPGL